MTIKELYKLFIQFDTVVTDTRAIVPNSLFFALKGDSFNGNLFAKEALNKGAKYAIVDENIDSLDSRLILVNNVLETLQNLANYHRRQLNIPVIGITGTNGKTTTKELIFTTLLQKYNAIATEGNLNNHIGVPLTLLKIKKQHEIAIVEMGANHLGEIAELCKIAEPNYGIITNVGKAHLEGFLSFENIIDTKLDLYRFVESVKGINFILKENSEFNDFIEKPNFINYSYKDSTANNYGKGEINDSFLKFTLEKIDDVNINKISINTKIVGLYNQSNLLAAITIGNYFKVPLDKIKLALENYTPSNNRSQLIETTRNKLILDAYNANPTSVKNALENFKEIGHPKKKIILADMLELGNFSSEEHQKITEQVIDTNIEAILIGPEFSKTKLKNKKIIKKYALAQELIDSGSLNNIKDSLILIKGSRGMKLEKLTKYL